MFGWFNKALIGNCELNLVEFTKLWSAFFFAGPKARTTICFALNIVSRPIVIAFLGTSSMDLKKREFAWIVSGFKLIILVCELFKLPGSLKAICPSFPTPKIRKSKPPAALIWLSYFALFGK